MKKEHTTFIQLGNLPPFAIPFWLYVAIMRVKHWLALSKTFVLRRLGKVYDPGRGLTKRAADFACTCREAGEFEMKTNPACPVHGEAAQSR